MPKEKACKICKTVYDESACPNCGSKEYTENFKGKIVVLKPEKSEAAQKLNIKQEGIFSIKN